MSNEAVMTIPGPVAHSRLATWVGIFLSLFSMLIIRAIFRRIAPDAGPGLTVLRELAMLRALRLCCGSYGFAKKSR